MEFSALLSFALYSFVTSVTPGPNNIMLTASGVNFGFKKSVPHILGIGFGFGVMVALVGMGAGSLLVQHPALFEALRIIGICYLLYLSWLIANAGSISSDGKKLNRPLSFIGAALFQWVNPKAWIMTMGAITAYAGSNATIRTFAIIGLIYGLISIPSVGVWAILGDRLQSYLGNKTRVTIFNISMGLLLAASTFISIYEAWMSIHSN